MLNYSVITTPLSIALLLASLAVPWAIINFQGQWAYTPVDILTEAADRDSARGAAPLGVKPHFFEFTSVNEEITFDLVISIVTFMTAAGVMVLSLVALVKKRWSKLSLLGGILAIIGGIAWIDAINSFKSAAVSNGLLGQLIIEILVTGFGPYLSIIAGIIPVFGFIIERISRTEDHKNHATDFNK